MSLTISKKFARLCMKNHPILFTAVRTHFNKDYKPGPFPKTQAEREAAAKKYGLHISEYEPYPDDGVGTGDYPKLPDISGDSKDPNYPWDNPELKRNFNEPMHAESDFYGEDRYDISFRHRIPLLTQFFQLAGVLFGTYAIYYFLEDMKMHPAILPKQYPHQGKTHYTFETNE